MQGSGHSGWRGYQLAGRRRYHADIMVGSAVLREVDSLSSKGIAQASEELLAASTRQGNQ